MGNAMTRSAALPFGKPSEPTPLLGFVAGEHAERIARFWPAPHTGFLVLPAARRHAAAVLLDRRWNGSGCDQLDIVHAVERIRDSELARILMRGESPGGLVKALGRMGEALWAPADYDRFLDLFADPAAVTILRHMQVIEARMLAPMAALPAPLRQPRIIAALPADPVAAEDLAEAWRIVRRIHGAEEAFRLVRRWERAGTPQKLFDRVADALEPASFGQVLPPPQLPDGFTLVANRKALNEVALEFRNCLRDFTADLAAGRMAVYVWRHAPSPPVALALRQDAAGWRLAEAKLAHNADLGEAHLRRLVDLLAGAGVRTGESTWALARRLHDHACPNCGPAHVPPRATWQDRLALGSLWD